MSICKTATWQSVLKENRESINGSILVLYRHCPSFTNIFQGLMPVLEDRFANASDIPLAS
jgi:hypothetical protein